MENLQEKEMVPSVDEPAGLSLVESQQLVKPKEQYPLVDPKLVKSNLDQGVNALIDPKLLKPGKIDDKGLFSRLYEAGLTHEEIASFFGVSREAVTRMVGRMDLVRETANPVVFQEKMQEEILIRMEALMKYMTPDKMSKASLSQLIMAFGVLYDKMRLHNGESTQNIANLNIHAFEGEDLEKIKEVIRKRTNDKLKKIKREYDKE